MSFKASDKELPFDIS